MSKTLTKGAVSSAALLLAALAMTGCGAETPDDPVGAEDGVSSTGAAAPTPAEALLADHGLDGMSTVEIIDRLDRLPLADRPGELVASVRPGELVVGDGAKEYSLDLPDDRFYLSVAPYVDQTHDCFHHSLTTCTGELASTDVKVEIVDRTNDEVLVDETRTTFENGFTGFWLPRHIEGTLRLTAGGRTAETEFSTDADSPTCLTTLRLV